MWADRQIGKSASGGGRAGRGRAFRDLVVWAVCRVPEYAHHARASARGSLSVAEAILPRLILLELQ